MALTEYFRDRWGDYLAVYPTRNTQPSTSGIVARVAAQDDNVTSIYKTTISPGYLSRCKPVRRQDVPQEWRLAFDGPNSGLDARTLLKAEQALWAQAWALALQDYDRSFSPASVMEPEAPPIPPMATVIVRGWIDDLNRILPYPLSDLTHAVGADDEGDAPEVIMRLINGCLDIGRDLSSWDQDRIAAAETILGHQVHYQPRNLESGPLDELARRHVADHPPTQTRATP